MGSLKKILKSLLLLVLLVNLSAIASCTKGDDINNNNSDNAPFELWMGQKTGSSGTWSNLRWMVILPGGDYFNQLPGEGFLNFSRSQTGGTWGTFTSNGNSGTFTNQYETLNVTRISDTEMEIAGYTNHLYKLAFVDGVRLSGKYVNGIPGWSTSGNYPYGSNDAQPMIQFESNGNFSDKGAFVTNFTMPNQDPQRAPGNGTYEIKNFTLILNYSDGRKIAKAFSGVLDKKVNAGSELVLVGGNPFYNR